MDSSNFIISSLYPSDIFQSSFVQSLKLLQMVVGYTAVHWLVFVPVVEERTQVSMHTVL
jgi:hypothetical protein